MEPGNHKFGTELQPTSDHKKLSQSSEEKESEGDGGTSEGQRSDLEMSRQEIGSLRKSDKVTELPAEDQGACPCQVKGAKEARPQERMVRADSQCKENSSTSAWGNATAKQSTGSPSRELMWAPRREAAVSTP